MNNLATKNINDFTVTETGEAFISQPKLANLLNINVGTVTSYISRSKEITNSSNGLDSNSLECAVAYFAMESKASTNEAKTLYRLIAKAGAKAYIYHEAGYTVNAAPPPPPKELTPLEVAHNALLTTTKALSDEIEERQKVEKMLEVAKTIELASCASENDISIDEFCKIVTSSLENTNLGRTKCYIIFRAIGLVETQSTRPTQRGMAIRD